MEEPSVLDYLKSLLMPWKGQRIQLPNPQSEMMDATSAAPDEETVLETATDSQDTLPVSEDPVAAAAQGNEQAKMVTQPDVRSQPARSGQPYRLPWLSILALLLGVFAQSGFETTNRSAGLGIRILWISWCGINRGCPA